TGSGARATVHRLQLIAGRPRARIGAPADSGAVRFTDLGVAAAGAVLVADAEGGRLYRIDPRGPTLTLVMTLGMASPAAVAVAGSDDVAYVAHADGVSRVDLAQRRVVPVTGWADTGTAIDGVWWHEGALVVMRVRREGERRLERWQLDRRG